MQERYSQRATNHVGPCTPDWQEFNFVKLHLIPYHALILSYVPSQWTVHWRLFALTASDGDRTPTYPSRKTEQENNHTVRWFRSTDSECTLENTIGRRLQATLNYSANRRVSG